LKCSIKVRKRLCCLLFESCDTRLGPLLGARCTSRFIKRCVELLLGAPHIAFVRPEPRRGNGNSALRSCLSVEASPAAIHVCVDGKSGETGPVLLETLTSRFEQCRCRRDLLNFLEMVSLVVLEFANGFYEGRQMTLVGNEGLVDCFSGCRRRWRLTRR
jgi:hypothetical protein